MNRVDRDRADVHNAQCILVLANDSSVENKQAEVPITLFFIIDVRMTLLHSNPSKIFLLYI